MTLSGSSALARYWITGMERGRPFSRIAPLTEQRLTVYEPNLIAEHEAWEKLWRWLFSFVLVGLAILILILTSCVHKLERPVIIPIPAGSAVHIIPDKSHLPPAASVNNAGGCATVTVDTAGAVLRDQPMRLYVVGTVDSDGTLIIRADLLAHEMQHWLNWQHRGFPNPD